MFRLTYGFTCTCPSCIAFKQLDTSLPVPDEGEFESFVTSLRDVVFPDSSPDAITLPNSPVDLETIPNRVMRILRESCLTRLCESFSTFSHDGPFESALQVGLTVLAFYVVIYPPNYPQIGVFSDKSCRDEFTFWCGPGMHLLEMAKTAWNAFITMENGSPGPAGVKLLAQVRAYLRLSSQVWAVIGSEGDEGGPLAEAQVLEQLLSEQGSF